MAQEHSMPLMMEEIRDPLIAPATLYSVQEYTTVLQRKSYLILLKQCRPWSSSVHMGFWMHRANLSLFPTAVTPLLTRDLPLALKLLELSAGGSGLDEVTTSGCFLLWKVEKDGQLNSYRQGYGFRRLFTNWLSSKLSSELIRNHDVLQGVVSRLLQEVLRIGF